MTNILTAKMKQHSVKKTPPKRKLRRFTLEVSFPFKMSTYTEMTEQVENLVGRRCSGAGTGFGTRDVTFSGLTKARVLSSVNALLSSKIKHLAFTVSGG